MYGFIRAISHTFLVNKTYLFAALFYCLLSPVNANEFLDDITIVEDDGVYYIKATAEISASEEQVRKVLTDYVHIYRLSDSIIESKVFRSLDNDKIEVETLVLCCVPLFCKEVTRVEEVSELESGLIQTRIIPEKSDFRSGLATWEIEQTEQVTRLTYAATLEPDFFIPPLLGTHMVIENMRDEFSITFHRIQHIARINEEREWHDGFKFTRGSKDQDVKPCNANCTANF